MSFKKKRAERRQIYDVLRKQSDFAHNMKVEKSGVGKLVVVQRSRNNASEILFSPCEYCLGYFKQNKLSSHRKTCSRTSSSSPSSSSSRILKRSSILSIAPGANEHLKEVFHRMRVDHVSTICKSDELIILCGNTLVMEHTEDGRDQFDVISNRLRMMGRLVLEVKHLDPTVRSLTDCINPAKYQIVQHATERIVRWGVLDKKLSPSNGIKMRHLLVFVCNRLKGSDIEKGDQNLKLLCDDFATLIQIFWLRNVGKRSRATLETSKRNKPVLLPLTVDVKRMKDYLDECLVDDIRELRLHPESLKV